ncbi:unnamed protein product [Musa textilis]
MIRCSILVGCWQCCSSFDQALKVSQSLPSFLGNINTLIELEQRETNMRHGRIMGWVRLEPGSNQLLPPDRFGPTGRPMGDPKPSGSLSSAPIAAPVPAAVLPRHHGPNPNPNPHPDPIHQAPVAPHRRAAVGSPAYPLLLAHLVAAGRGGDTLIVLTRFLQSSAVYPSRSGSWLRLFCWIFGVC